MVAMANFAVKSAIFHARGLNVVFPVSRVLGGSGDKMAEFISNSAILPVGPTQRRAYGGVQFWPRAQKIGRLYRKVCHRYNSAHYGECRQTQAKTVKRGG